MSPLDTAKTVGIVAVIGAAGYVIFKAYKLAGSVSDTPKSIVKAAGEVVQEFKDKVSAAVSDTGTALGMRTDTSNMSTTRAAAVKDLESRRNAAKAVDVLAKGPLLGGASVLWGAGAALLNHFNPSPEVKFWETDPDGVFYD